MNYLVTGAGGFIGSYLVESLLEEDHSVCAISRSLKKESFSDNNNLKLHEVNIRDIDLLESIILDYKPNVIFHLAAQSSPGVSLEYPKHTFEINTMGTIDLLEITKKLNYKPRTILLSSSAVYAKSIANKIIDENFPITPSSPYGASKYAMEEVGRLYVEHQKMDIIIVRPFFLIGPKKRDDVCSAFARSIVDIESGKKSHLNVGDLSIIRDFLNIKDGIQALSLVSEMGDSGEVYNISSGVGFSLREILDLFNQYTEKNIIEVIDPKRIRKIDDTIRIGDPTKIKKLGWKPSFPIERTIHSILDYWRKEKH